MRGQLRNREATLLRADGVVSSAECRVFAGLTTPSPPLQGGFAPSLLMSRPPPLRGGECCL
jgi:hypothetical protein